MLVFSASNALPEHDFVPLQNLHAFLQAKIEQLFPKGTDKGLPEEDAKKRKRRITSASLGEDPRSCHKKPMTVSKPPRTRKHGVSFVCFCNKMTHHQQLL